MYFFFTMAAFLALGDCMPWPRYGKSLSIPLDEIDNSGATPLPYPSTAQKYIAVQVGTQNYTCNSTSGKYTATGALARIYDATQYLSSHPDKVDSLSQTYLDAYTSLPCSMRPSDCVELDDACEDLANLRFRGGPLPILGEHYFNAAGTPTFDLYAAPGHPYLEGKKIGDVPAPEESDVDWLYLTSNGSPQNKIISSVYRIETAGGVQPASCSGSGSIEVPYAAHYWYYA